MENKIVEIFIPGPAGRLEAKYFKNQKITSPIALVLQPHPQYGGTMNNKVVVETFNTFMENDFSVCRVNFRGVGKSDGEFDNGQGELADAAAALDWIERQNLDYSQCWVSGFSFGSLICMQLIMRRPEVNNFIAVSPQPNVYDFSFLAPCPTSGQIIYSDNDELVSKESITELDNRIRSNFPHKFGEQKKSSGPRVASAGATASKTVSPKGRRTVKLTSSQIAIAKRLNVPLEEYAKYVKE